MVPYTKFGRLVFTPIADLVYGPRMGEAEARRQLVGYLRVGHRERRASRPSRTDQRRAIEALAAQRGWQIVGWEDDIRTGRTLRRPGLLRAIDTCRNGRAEGIVVARLDRLTTALQDLATLMRSAIDGGYGIVAPDLGIDLSTESGHHLAQVLAAVSTWEPHGIGRLTAQPAPVDHPRRSRGRPSSTPPDVAGRIRALRTSGATLQAICDILNSEGVPTPRGGTHWRPTSLRAIVREGARAS
jgi:DNA invertase Pin-like site-specific DNA recombinase